jgi:membrane protein implicated in regulation of membrane protease activity
MLTGTFYILMLSLGAAAGGIVSVIGVTFFGQYVTAAIISIVGAVFIYLSRLAHPPTLNTDTQNLDIGQSVDVHTWNQDGTAKVMYRGAPWEAEAAEPDTPRNKRMYIKELRGVTLVLTDRKPK